MNKAFLLLVVAALFGIGSALKCYHCSDLDVNTPDCRGTKMDANFGKECQEPDNQCLKLVSKGKLNEITSVERKCANSDNKPERCDKNDNYDATSCYFCNKDLCNAAAIPSSVSALVFILPVALFLFTGSSR